MNREIVPKLKNIITKSHKEAIKLGESHLKPEHIMLITLVDDNNGVLIALEKMNIDINNLLDKIYLFISNDNQPKITTNNNRNTLPFSKETKKIIGTVDTEAEILNDNHIDTTHVVLSILNKNNDIPLRKLLLENNITYNKFFNEVKNLRNISVKIKDSINKIENKKPTPKITKTPILDNFATNLNNLAKMGKLTEVIGRKTEIKRLMQILSRKTKNNPIILGQAGTGKTAIVEGVTMLIESDNPPKNLIGKELYSLDLTSIVAGTKYRGQFEERMQAIMEEVKKNGNIILFIDEIHTFVGAGNSSGSLDVSNILKPSLSRGEIQVIGATTLDEYRENIEKDSALTRRFQKIIIEPTNKEKTIEILSKIKNNYGDYHNVSYSDECIEECVNLAHRYISNRAMPDSAIDIMDEVGASMNILNEKSKVLLSLEKEKQNLTKDKDVTIKQQEFEKAAELRDSIRIIDEKIKKELVNNKKERYSITIEDIRNVLSIMVNIPLSKLNEKENVRLLDIETNLKNKIIGQDKAIEKISSSIKRSRLGIKNKNKPSSFIFLGSSGVGKTLVCKELSKEIYGGIDNMIRLDMSEYMEKHSVSKIIGSPPGYVGYEKGGELTEMIKNKPYSLILFDEIEKAHPDIFNILLQVLDEGFLTDSLGSKIDFKNTTIVLTSNVGTKDVEDFKQPLGFQTKPKLSTQMEREKQIIDKALKQKFKPEFLNRIDEIIVFNRLSKEDTLKIVEIEINDLKNRLNSIDYNIKVSKKVYEFINDKSYDESYGARPIYRAIQKYLEEPIADLILKGEFNENDIINIKVVKDNLKFN
jgi:ATP-dependent Clp protease ATP-binding subunit ClpC